MYSITYRYIFCVIVLLLCMIPKVHAEEEAITFSGIGDGPIEIVDQEGQLEVLDTESNERMSYAPNWGKAARSSRTQQPTANKQVAYVSDKDTKLQEATINAMLKKRRVALRKPLATTPPKKRK